MAGGVPGWSEAHVMLRRWTGIWGMVALCALLVGCGAIPTPQQAIVPPVGGGQVVNGTSRHPWEWRVPGNWLVTGLYAASLRVAASVVSQRSSASAVLWIDDKGRVVLRVPGGQTAETAGGRLLVLIARNGHLVLALWASAHRELWQRSLDAIPGSLLLTKRGVVIYAEAGRTVAIAPNGTTLWRLPMAVAAIAARRGLVALAGADGVLYRGALDRTPLIGRSLHQAPKQLVMDNVGRLWALTAHALYTPYAKVALANGFNHLQLASGNNVLVYGAYRSELVTATGQVLEQSFGNQLASVGLVRGRVRLLWNHTSLPNRPSYVTVRNAAGEVLAKVAMPVAVQTGALSPSGRSVVVAASNGIYAFAMPDRNPPSDLLPAPIWRVGSGANTVLSAPGANRALLLNERPRAHLFSVLGMMTASGHWVWQPRGRTAQVAAVARSGVVALAARGTLSLWLPPEKLLWHYQWPGVVAKVALDQTADRVAAWSQESGFGVLRLVGSDSRVLWSKRLDGAMPSAMAVLGRGPDVLITYRTDLGQWAADLVGAHAIRRIAVFDTRPVVATAGNGALFAAGRAQGMMHLVWLGSAGMVRSTNLAGPGQVMGATLDRRGMVNIWVRRSVPGLFGEPESDMDEVLGVSPEGQVLWVRNLGVLVAAMARPVGSSDLVLTLVDSIRAVPASTLPATSLMVLDGKGKILRAYRVPSGIADVALGPAPGVLYVAHVSGEVDAVKLPVSGWSDR